MSTDLRCVMQVPIRTELFALPLNFYLKGGESRVVIFSYLVWSIHRKKVVGTTNHLVHVVNYVLVAPALFEKLPVVV